MTIIQIAECKLIRACGSVHDITDWLDAAGEDCAPEQAVQLLADDNGACLIVDLRSFTAVQFQ